MVERPNEKQGAMLTLVRVPGAAKDFSPSVSSQCRLSYGVRAAPCVQSHVSASVRTLQIPSTGIHTIVWTHGNNYTHTLMGMGIAPLLWLLCFTQVTF